MFLGMYNDALFHREGLKGQSGRRRYPKNKDRHSLAVKRPLETLTY